MSEENKQPEENTKIEELKTPKEAKTLEEIKMPKHDIRVITFNMLSHSAATAAYFPFVDGRYLYFKHRVSKMKKLLTSWMKVNFIICLQEFSKEWEYALKGFFETKKYKIVSKLYARDKMGVAIAYPTNHFDLLDSNITTLSEEIRDVSNFIKRWDGSVINPSAEGSIKYSVVAREIEMGEHTKNILLSLIFRPKYLGKDIGKNLIISTYHMPCKFTQKYYMIAQIVALKTNLAKLVESVKKNNPGEMSLIVTGDFNISPVNPEHKLLTGLTYTDEELKNPAYEAISTMKSVYEMNDMSINQGIKLRSAHYVLHNKEPEYTNVSVKVGATFVGCLDYILIDETIDVRSCTVGLTTEDPIQASYPNGICPSDHIPLSASLRI